MESGKKYDCAHNLVVSSLILSSTELLFLKPSLFTEQFIAKTNIKCHVGNFTVCVCSQHFSKAFSKDNSTIISHLNMDVFPS